MEQAEVWPFDVFISYARKDNENGWVTALRDRLVRDAQTFGTRLEVFFDADSIRDGDQWRERILRALQQSKVLLVCLSPNFMASIECRREWDEYVRRETNTAPDARFVVWFVDLPGTDPEESRGWRERILATNLTDFRPWYDRGPDAFDDEEFGRLLGRLGRNVARKLEEHRRADRVPRNLSGRAEHFVGRSQELQRLHHLIGLGPQGAITVVHGLGGLGKTQLVVQYAHKHRGSFPGGVWQVDAERAAGVLPALGPLATHLGVDAAGRDPSEVGELVLAALRQRCAEEGADASALVLLDNVADPAVLAVAELGSVPDVPWLKLVVTTRLSPGELALSPRLGFVPVEPLSVQACVELLEHFQPERDGSLAGVFTSDAERAAARDVAVLLGGFTLAVEQVAAFLRRNPGRTVARMRDDLVERGLVAADRLGDTVASDLLHRDKRVAVVLDQTLGSLEPAALTALQCASLLPPDEIPWPWLQTLAARRHPELTDDHPFSGDPWYDVRRRLEGQQLLGFTDNPEVARLHRVIGEHVAGRLSPVDREHLEAELAGLLAAWCDEIVAGRVFPAWIHSALAHATVAHAARPAVLRSFGDALGRLAQYVVDGTVLQIAVAQRDHLRDLAARQPDNLQALRDVSVSLNNVAGLERYSDATAALTGYRESLAISRDLAARQPDNLQALRDVSVSLDNVADLERYSDATAALTGYRESLAISRDLAARQPDNLQALRDVSVSLNNVAGLERYSDATAALTGYRESLAIRRDLAARQPDNLEALRDVSVSLDNVAGLERYSDATAALTGYRESLAISRDLAARQPDNLEALRDVSVSLDNVAGLERYSDATAALTGYRESLAIRRDLAARQPDNLEALRDVSVSLDNVADLERYSGATAALTGYRESLAIRRDLAARQPDNLEALRDVSVSLNKVADLERYSDATAALTGYRESLAISRDLAARQPDNLEALRDVSVSLNNVAGLERYSDATAALTGYRESLAISRDLAARQPDNLQALRDVSVSLDNVADLERYSDATAALTGYRESLAIRRDLAARQPDNLEALRDVSVSLFQLARLGESNADLGVDVRALVTELANLLTALEGSGYLDEDGQRVLAWARGRRAEQPESLSHPEDDPAGDARRRVTRELADRGVRLDPTVENALLGRFYEHLQERVGTCMTALLSDATMERLEPVIASAVTDPSSQHALAAELSRAVPTQPEIVADVQASLLDELAAHAISGVVGAELTDWPLPLPDFDTRAETVLWCRGFRPPADELAEASARLGERADERRWQDEVESLTDLQREEYLAAQEAVEQGEIPRDRLGSLWQSWFPDRTTTYLRHLGHVISDFLGEQRA